MKIDWDWIALLVFIAVVAVFGSCEDSADVARRKCAVEVVKAGKTVEEAKVVCK